MSKATTLTIRLPVGLARELKAKARLAKTTASAILREAAAQYVKGKSTVALNRLQQHINARAGTWDGHFGRGIVAEDASVTFR